MVLRFVGLASSTYYSITGTKEVPALEVARDRSHGGRPRLGYSLDVRGRKVSDEQIKEYLCELIAGEESVYGYRKLAVCLREGYGLRINHKKVYRLCKELGILGPKRREKPAHLKRLPRRDIVDGPNQLWEVDVKYGYIAGQDSFFFQLSLIDVFDRSVLAYHLGLTCTALDACRVVRQAVAARGLRSGDTMPKVRTDNGPQFASRIFAEQCERLGLTHERIPPRTPDLNAHIEAFHSILEAECYSRHEFASFKDAYETISAYMAFYNKRRRHGSLRQMSPAKFHAAFVQGRVTAQPFVA